MVQGAHHKPSTTPLGTARCQHSYKVVVEVVVVCCVWGRKRREGEEGLHGARGLVLPPSRTARRCDPRTRHAPRVTCEPLMVDAHSSRSSPQTSRATQGHTTTPHSTQPYLRQPFTIGAKAAAFVAHPELIERMFSACVCLFPAFVGWCHSDLAGTFRCNRDAPRHCSQPALAVLSLAEGCVFQDLGAAVFMPRTVNKVVSWRKVSKRTVKADRIACRDREHFRRRHVVSPSFAADVAPLRWRLRK